MNALAVADDALGIGKRVRNRHVALAGRKRPGQTTGGLKVTGDDRGEGVPGLLTGEPAPQHGCRALEPREQNRRARVDDDDGVRGHVEHCLDELILPAGQGQTRAVPALGLDLFVRANDDDGQLACPGELDGFGELVICRGAWHPMPEGRAHDRAVATGSRHKVRRLDLHDARLVDLDRDLAARRVVDGRVENDLDARGHLVLRDELAVDDNAVAANGADREVVDSRLVEADADRQGDAVGLVGEVPHPAVPLLQRARFDHRTLAVEQRGGDACVGGGAARQV